MQSILLATLALGNLALYLYPQTGLDDVQWPTHAVAALPQGWLKPGETLFLLENEQPITAQIEVVARWPDGSPKWLHVHASFRYAGGKPAKYRLVSAAQPPEAAARSRLHVRDEPAGITIETGILKLVIPRPFAGVSLVEHEGQRVIEGPGGPSMIDSRGIVWQAMHDTEAEVVIEQQGPAQVTVKASGWYQTEDRRVEPFCRFTTRITAFAESPLVKFDHATTFAGDMRQQAIAELAFKFVVPGVRNFSAPTRSGAFDGELQAVWFAQLSPQHLFTLLQNGPDELRGLQAKGDYERSAGWFRAGTAERSVTLLTKDFWQKCPKEVKVGREELTYFAWPKHGDLARPDEAATRPENVYKFLCFQSGRLLDPSLPNEYFTALEHQNDTSECKPEYARAASLEGVSLHNEFALLFTSGANTASTDAYLAKYQQLYAQSPLARASPAAFASSGALGPVAASNSQFPRQQKTARDGMLGYARSIERYSDYGWAIYGNTHHEEFMNPSAAGVEGGRPSLHRVWSNNHYQQVSTSWRLFALDGDPRLLHWARQVSNNYASIGQVRYDGLRGRKDGKGQQIAGPSVKFHHPGAFWHCKAFVPWGGRDYGMDRNDVDADLTGHWPDPSGLLLAWLIDGDRWAKDGYDLWRAQVRFPNRGTGREINTTLVHAITAQEYEPREETLQAIRDMAKGLMTKPIMTQRPGPIWEPTWLSRYYEMFPEDEAFKKYLLESADAVGVGVEGIWSLALSATAYRITGDEKYLRRHAGTLERAARGVFYDPVADKRWDLYGFGPGPDRDGHFMLQWHRFHAALGDAKIAELAPPDEPGHYFCGVSRFDNSKDVLARGTKIVFWREQPGPTPLKIEACPASSGDLHAASLELLSPQGQSLQKIDRLRITASGARAPRVARPSTWLAAVDPYTAPTDMPGLYTLLLGSDEIGVFQGVSGLPECQILRNTKVRQWSEPVVHVAKLTRGHLAPLTRAPIKLNFTAMGTRDGTYMSVRNSQGQPLIAQHVRAGSSISVTLNTQASGAGPWLLDAFSDKSGYFKMTVESNVDEPLLYGHRLSDLQLIQQKLGR